MRHTSARTQLTCLSSPLASSLFLWQYHYVLSPLLLPGLCCLFFCFCRGIFSLLSCDGALGEQLRECCHPFSAPDDTERDRFTLTSPQPT